MADVMFMTKSSLYTICGRVHREFLALFSTPFRLFFPVGASIEAQMVPAFRTACRKPSSSLELLSWYWRWSSGGALASRKLRGVKSSRSISL